MSEENSRRGCRENGNFLLRLAISQKKRGGKIDYKTECRYRNSNGMENGRKEEDKAGRSEQEI